MRPMTPVEAEYVSATMEYRPGAGYSSWMNEVYCGVVAALPVRQYAHVGSGLGVAHGAVYWPYVAAALSMELAEMSSLVARCRASAAAMRTPSERPRRQEGNTHSTVSVLVDGEQVRTSNDTVFAGMSM